jgi:hypothetical protein
MAFWKLNSDLFRALWLMAAGTRVRRGWGWGITLAEGLHDWSRQAVPLFNYALTFALLLRKSMKNLSQCSRVVADFVLRRLGLFLRTSSAVLLSISSQRLLVGDFSQPPVSTRTFQIAILRDSPHQRTLHRNTPRQCSDVLGEKRPPPPQSSWISVLPMMQGASVAMQRHLDSKICSFQTWLQAADPQIEHAQSFTARKSCS